MPTAEQLREHWQGLAAAGLPAAAQTRERNAAITTRYLRWYLQEPTLLKWAGAAAFASRQVGRAIAVHHYARNGKLLGKILKPPFGKGKAPFGKGDLLPLPLDLGEMIDDIEILTTTNSAVFADIGWAHAAYLDAAGGMQAIEDALADQPASPILSGFRKIESGRVLLAGSPASAVGINLIWDGNKELLRHEQEHLIQPPLDAMTREMGRVMSATTWMDFDPAHMADDSLGAVIALLLETGDLVKGRSSATSFLPFMLVRGKAVLNGAPLPKFTILAHRWFWVENSVLPLWRRIEKTDPTLHQRMPDLGRITII